MTIKIKSTQGPIRISVPAGAAPVYLGGQPGPHGLSAYEVAVLNGFSGTEAEWLVSLGADVALSALPNNKLTAETDGLYVPPPQLASAQW